MEKKQLGLGSRDLHGDDGWELGMRFLGYGFSALVSFLFSEKLR